MVCMLVDLLDQQPKFLHICLSIYPITDITRKSLISVGAIINEVRRRFRTNLQRFRANLQCFCANFTT